MLRKTKKNANAGHVCLIGTNAPLRTDESFRNQENEQHHHDDSPLEELQIDMIRDIPLEYLHLILYGVMKRLLTLWVNGTINFKFQYQKYPRNTFKPVVRSRRRLISRTDH